MPLLGAVKGRPDRRPFCFGDVRKPHSRTRTKRLKKSLDNQISEPGLRNCFSEEPPGTTDSGLGVVCARYEFFTAQPGSLEFVVAR
jgi:hypothetical protein